MRGNRSDRDGGPSGHCRPHGAGHLLAGNRGRLGSVGEGALVNIEVDIVAKHVGRLLEARA